MGCLTGWSRADLLEWGSGRGRTFDSQRCARDTHSGRLGRQLCKGTPEEAHRVDDGDDDHSPNMATLGG